MPRVLLVLDVAHSRDIPKAVANEPGAIRIDSRKVIGVIGHLGDSLYYLDREPTSCWNVVVLTGDDPPNARVGIERWGYGWRCGRDLDTDWAQVAVRERRALSFVWITIHHGTASIRQMGNSAIEIESGFLDRVLNDRDTFILTCKRRQHSLARFRDAEIPRTVANVELWHGSSTSGLRYLTAEHRRLWLSFSQTFAACFCASPYTKEGFYQGVERVGIDDPIVYLVVPRGRENCLSRPCSLYRVETPVCELRLVGVTGYETIIHRELEVASEVRYSSCRELFEEANVEVVEMVSSVPVDASLAAKCYPYRHALEAFLEIPFEVAIRLRCKQWALHLWLAARGLAEIPDESLKWLANAIERAWLPMIAADSDLPENGYHSLQHLLKTSLISALIATKEGVNPVVAAFAGLLHDVGRRGDEDDAIHADLGMTWIERVLGRKLRYLFSTADFELIRTAVTEHTKGQVSKNRIIGACWDADRLRLAWERGVNQGFFSTLKGLSYARAGAEKVQEDIALHFGPRYAGR
jgi:hypothetical protein